MGWSARGGSVRTGKAAALILVLVAVLAACTSTPPPPVVTSPVAQSSTTPTAIAPSQIVIGVDDIAGGYNPHNLADQSTITTALAQLLLPSVFRQSDDGQYKLDTTLMRSAEVTSQDPFTVTYEIRQDASWSDGAPIAVEDFAYLADAMRNQPGVAEPAGYRLISQIQPGEGGKRVQVVFSKPYRGWQTLFSDLLPQHLLKDAPGGWQGALQSGFPAYGGPFSIKQLDTARGEIILERNERYWDKPAAVDQLVLRRADGAGMAAALRSGNDQFVMSRTDSTGLKLLQDLGELVTLHTVPGPRVAQVLLRPAGGPLTNDGVRAGVAALIDRNKLIDKGTAGGPSAGLRADAQVLPPSAQGYAVTIPPSIASANPGEAERLLKAAGYTKDAGTWRKDGKALSLVIAAPGQQEPYATIAKELAAELVAQGVQVSTINPAPRDLYSGQLAMPVSRSGQNVPDGSGNVAVDIAVIPMPVDGDPATVLASTFGCRPGQQDSTSSATPVVPANPAAFCDTALQPAIDAALAGTKPLPEALSELEPKLWATHVVLPLFQAADTLAVGSGISGLTPGPAMVGPFGSAVNWTRGGK
ncbi:ABC transporter family substrate-binding protein [Amycolatopsis cynarae]|uniref:ABC transporter family substrate-binding protein n=1 Tax=Amycolatopsis cynarae TaxID=2995223 RepID=A0ABY7B362_9PSEU|nr:ABC transporter family substrate-binding protein [Amycolatopsis sp. HUAS 11-8]WAL66745.1 ABC transporter family substrate-binding protein [Amycolatopsis sp. HUAS 11-8]